MIYECINCQSQWEKEGGSNSDGFLSHGLCRDCLREKLIPLYKERQKLESPFDCFGSARDYCDQANCKYRKYCFQIEQKE